MPQMTMMPHCIAQHLVEDHLQRSLHTCLLRAKQEGVTTLQRLQYLTCESEQLCGGPGSSLAIIALQHEACTLNTDSIERAHTTALHAADRGVYRCHPL